MSGAKIYKAGGLYVAVSPANKVIGQLPSLDGLKKALAKDSKLKPVPIKAKDSAFKKLEDKGE